VSEHVGLLSKPEKSEDQNTVEYHAKLAYKLMKRSHYITPLNICQVRYLEAARAMEIDESKGMEKLQKIPMLEGYPFQDYNYKGAVNDVLKITMKGIAAGMQNTG